MESRRNARVIKLPGLPELNKRRLEPSRVIDERIIKPMPRQRLGPPQPPPPPLNHLRYHATTMASSTDNVSHHTMPTTLSSNSLPPRVAPATMSANSISHRVTPTTMTNTNILRRTPPTILSHNANVPHRATPTTLLSNNTNHHHHQQQQHHLPPTASQRNNVYHSMRPTTNSMDNNTRHHVPSTTNHMRHSIPQQHRAPPGPSMENISHHATQTVVPPAVNDSTNKILELVANKLDILTEKFEFFTKIVVEQAINNSSISSQNAMLRSDMDLYEQNNQPPPEPEPQEVLADISMTSRDYLSRHQLISPMSNFIKKSY